MLYILLGCIVILLIILLRKIDIATELIYNRLNIEDEIWGDDKNV